MELNFQMKLRMRLKNKIKLEGEEIKFSIFESRKS
jgi:hypothetical protein